MTIFSATQKPYMFRLIANAKTPAMRLEFRRKLIKCQQGDFLIEALIGLALMAIIAVGVTTITSKVETGKREMSVQDLAISQLRELLIKNGDGSVNLCDATLETVSLPDETLTVTRESGCTAVTGTINGVTFTDLKQPIVLSVTSGKYGKFTVGGAAAQQ